jgi:hypothetical protein
LPMQAPNGTEVLHAIQRRMHGKATA